MQKLSDIIKDHECAFNNVVIDEDIICNSSEIKSIIALKYPNRKTWLSALDCVGAQETLWLLNEYKYIHLYKTTAIEYDPITNYDKTETFNKTSSGKFNNLNSGTNTLSSSLTSKNDNTLTNTVDNSTTTNYGSGTTDMDNNRKETTTHNVTEKETDNNRSIIETPNTASITAKKGMNNPNEFSDCDKTYTEGSNNTVKSGSTENTTVGSDELIRNGSTTTTKTGTDVVINKTTNTDISKESKTDTGNDTTTVDMKLLNEHNDNENYELKTKGNIGVTTSQQMIDAERNLVRYSFLDEYVADLVRIISIV